MKTIVIYIFLLIIFVGILVAAFVLLYMLGIIMGGIFKYIKDTFFTKTKSYEQS